MDEDKRFKELFMMIVLNDFNIKEEKQEWLEKLDYFTRMTNLRERKDFEDTLYDIYKRQREELVKVTIEHLK